MYTDINLTTNSALRITKIPLVAYFFPKKMFICKILKIRESFDFLSFFLLFKMGIPLIKIPYSLAKVDSLIGQKYSLFRSVK